MSVSRSHGCATVRRTKLSRSICIVSNRCNPAYGESPEIASCEYTGGIRKARIDSSQAARDRQFHETRRCSGSNSLRCTTHINHAYEVGDQTKRNPIGRLGVDRFAAGSETHCITDSVTTGSSTLLGCGITENAGVHSRCAGLSWRSRTPL